MTDTSGSQASGNPSQTPGTARLRSTAVWAASSSALNDRIAANVTAALVRVIESAPVELVQSLSEEVRRTIPEDVLQKRLAREPVASTISTTARTTTTTTTTTAAPTTTATTTLAAPPATATTSMTAPTVTTTSAPTTTTTSTSAPMSAAEASEVRTRAREAVGSKIPGQVRRRVEPVRNGTPMRCSEGTSEVPFKATHQTGTVDDIQWAPFGLCKSPSGPLADPITKVPGACLPQPTIWTLATFAGRIRTFRPSAPNAEAADSAPTTADGPAPADPTPGEESLAMIDLQSTCRCRYGGVISFNVRG